MKSLISPAAMQAREQNYFRTGGVPSIEIMENAARALADRIASELPEGSSIHFACGTGGNGGDGTACARLLSNRYRCAIIQPREPKSPDAVENLRRARASGIPVLPEPAREVPDAWVDALFGTGLSRAPSGPEAELIRHIETDRERGARVYAADIPSGLNGATGQAYAPCVRADHTVTFQHAKTGLVLADGLDVCGKITIADVGFPPFNPSVFDALLIEPSDIPRLLSSRPRNIHKGNCGHLLIVAGSFGMAGAAAMCARAALRSGVGLLTIACVKSIVSILQTLVPQAMCIPLDEENGVISVSALPALESTLSGKNAAVIGPGLTRRAPAEIVRAVLESGIPAAVDADALNILAEHHELFPLLRKKHVLTPHPGEARRLLPDLNPADPVAAARALSDLGATALYKGAACFISDGADAYVSRSGCCGMARGGSGDVLSGILGSLLAEQSDRSHALTAALASEIHGLAGELAQEKYGPRGMNALDITEFLPEVLPR